MTLKNEFLTAHSISGGIGMNEKQAVQCEKITNDFAIGFAKWLLNERTGFNRETETKELLEIYKKTL